MRRILSIAITLIAMVCLIGCASIEKAVDKPYADITGSVESISKYGNIYISATAQNAADAGLSVGDIVEVFIDGRMIVMPIGTSYSDVDNGSYLVKLNGEAEGIEIAINHGNFAGNTNSTIGTEVTIKMHKKGGYADEYMIRHLEKSEKREDYASDEVFANFREVTVGNIKRGRLYRGCNPVYGDARAPYAEVLIKNANIKTVINLADSEASAAKHIDEAPNYKALYENGDVILLDMAVDFYAPQFIQQFNKGLVFLSEHEGPYYIHCNEGKDRAGYVNAVLQALCGATTEEIKADYMRSFENYFGVEKGTEQYKAISNIAQGFLNSLNGGEAPLDEELSKITRAYLVNTVKLTDTQIDAIINNLTK